MNNKLTPELEKIRDENAERYYWQDGTRGSFLEGFEICYKAMNLEMNLILGMKFMLKETRVPLADVQVLLDALTKIKDKDFRGNRPQSAVDAYKALETWNAKHGNGDAK